jgi:hypothetical protein
VVVRLVRPFRALVSFGTSNRRASPWAVLGCPVGAKGRDLSWRLPWGRFRRFEILSVVLLLAAWRLRGFSSLVPFTDTGSQHFRWLHDRTRVYGERGPQ